MQEIPSLSYVQMKKGRLQIKKHTKASITMHFVLWALLAMTVIGPFLLDYGKIDWITAIALTLGNLKMMFLQPAFNQITFGTAMMQIGITVALAFLATVLLYRFS